ncbi:SBP2 [Scenedesmus sp. PABB004]|nr:SBP2 [Scenedesmus sp. PABB004]
MEPPPAESMHWAPEDVLWDPHRLVAVPAASQAAGEAAPGGAAGAPAPPPPALLPPVLGPPAGPRERVQLAHAVCKVQGCTALLREQKPYYQRFMLCEAHMRCLAISVDGVPSRFCQQCAKFEPVEAFDGTKRSCRARLQEHNKRRRKLGINNRSLRRQRRSAAASSKASRVAAEARRAAQAAAASGDGDGDDDDGGSEADDGAMEAASGEGDATMGSCSRAPGALSGATRSASASVGAGEPSGGASTSKQRKLSCSDSCSRAAAEAASDAMAASGDAGWAGSGTWQPLGQAGQAAAPAGLGAPRRGGDQVMLDAAASAAAASAAQEDAVDVLLRELMQPAAPPAPRQHTPAEAAAAAHVSSAAAAAALACGGSTSASVSATLVGSTAAAAARSAGISSSRLTGCVAAAVAAMPGLPVPPGIAAASNLEQVSLGELRAWRAQLLADAARQAPGSQRRRQCAMAAEVVAMLVDYKARADGGAPHRPGARGGGGSGGLGGAGAGAPSPLPPLAARAPQQLAPQLAASFYALPPDASSSLSLSASGCSASGCSACGAGSAGGGSSCSCSWHARMLGASGGAAAAAWAVAAAQSQLRKRPSAAPAVPPDMVAVPSDAGHATRLPCLPLDVLPTPRPPGLARDDSAEEYNMGLGLSKMRINSADGAALAAAAAAAASSPGAKLGHAPPAPRGGQAAAAHARQAHLQAQLRDQQAQLQALHAHVAATAAPRERAPPQGLTPEQLEEWQVDQELMGYVAQAQVQQAALNRLASGGSGSGSLGSFGSLGPPLAGGGGGGGGGAAQQVPAPPGAAPCGGDVARGAGAGGGFAAAAWREDRAAALGTALAVARGGAGAATYGGADAALRLSLKLHDATPAALAPGLLPGLNGLLAGGHASVECGYMRPGCVHLVLQLRAELPAPAPRAMAAPRRAAADALSQAVAALSGSDWARALLAGGAAAGGELALTVQLPDERAVLLRGGQHAGAVDLRPGAPPAQEARRPLLAAVAPCCVCLPAQRGGGGSVTVVARGARLDGAVALARSQGTFLPADAADAAPAAAGGALGDDDARVCVALQRLPACGLVQLEFQRGLLLSEARPLLVVDSPAVAAELGRLARALDAGGDAAAAAEQVLVDFGRLLDFRAVAQRHAAAPDAGAAGAPAAGAQAGEAPAAGAAAGGPASAPAQSSAAAAAAQWPRSPAAAAAAAAALGQDLDLDLLDDSAHEVLAAAAAPRGALSAPARSGGGPTESRAVAVEASAARGESAPAIAAPPAAEQGLARRAEAPPPAKPAPGGTLGLKKGLLRRLSFPSRSSQAAASSSSRGGSPSSGGGGGGGSLGRLSSVAAATRRLLSLSHLVQRSRSFNGALGRLSSSRGGLESDASPPGGRRSQSLDFTARTGRSFLLRRGAPGRASEPASLAARSVGGGLAPGRSSSMLLQEVERQLASVEQRMRPPRPPRAAGGAEGAAGAVEGGGDDDSAFGACPWVEAPPPAAPPSEAPPSEAAAEHPMLCAEYKAAMTDVGVRLLRFLVDRGWAAAAGCVLDTLLTHAAPVASFAAVASAVAADDGLGLLHRAVRSRRMRMVVAALGWAVAHRALCAWDAPGPAGLTPLHLAAALAGQDRHGVAVALLRSSPAVCGMWFDVRDASGATPAMLATALGLTHLNRLAHGLLLGPMAPAELRTHLGRVQQQQWELQRMAGQLAAAQQQRGGAAAACGAPPGAAELGLAERAGAAAERSASPERAAERAGASSESGDQPEAAAVVPPVARAAESGAADEAAAAASDGTASVAGSASKPEASELEGSELEASKPEVSEPESDGEGAGGACLPLADAASSACGSECDSQEHAPWAVLDEGAGCSRSGSCSSSGGGSGGVAGVLSCGGTRACVVDDGPDDASREVPCLAVSAAAAGLLLCRRHLAAAPRLRASLSWLLRAAQAGCAVALFAALLADSPALMVGAGVGCLVATTLTRLLGVLCAGELHAWLTDAPALQGQLALLARCVAAPLRAEHRRLSLVFADPGLEGRYCMALAEARLAADGWLCACVKALAMGLPLAVRLRGGGGGLPLLAGGAALCAWDLPVAHQLAAVVAGALPLAAALCGPGAYHGLRDSLLAAVQAALLLVLRKPLHVPRAAVAAAAAAGPCAGRPLLHSSTAAALLLLSRQRLSWAGWQAVCDVAVCLALLTLERPCPALGVWLQVALPLAMLPLIYLRERVDRAMFLAAIARRRACKAA